MAIVGFSFTKILAKRTAPVKGKVSINNNVSLANVEEANLSLGKEKKGLKVHFAFETLFEPKIGMLHFEGEIVLLEEAKRAEELLQGWAEKKNLPKEVVTPVLNNILDRCNIQALIMARDLGLPAPVQLPKVQVKQPAVQKLSKEEVEKIKAEKEKKKK